MYIGVTEMKEPTISDRTQNLKVEYILASDGDTGDIRAALNGWICYLLENQNHKTREGDDCHPL